MIREFSASKIRKVTCSTSSLSWSEDRRTFRKSSQLNWEFWWHTKLWLPNEGEGHPHSFLVSGKGFFPGRPATVYHKDIKFGSANWRGLNTSNIWTDGWIFSWNMMTLEEDCEVRLKPLVQFDQKQHCLQQWWYHKPYGVHDHHPLHTLLPAPKRHGHCSSHRENFHK